MCTHITVVLLLLLLLLLLLSLSCLKLVVGCSPKMELSCAQDGQVVRNAPVLMAENDRNELFFGQKSSWSHSMCFLASENLPEWKLGEGYSVQTQMYIWGSRIRPVETGRKYCMVPYQRRKTSGGFSVEAMLLY